MADRALTGVLLVGGASSRFGSPKALARLRGETLAERAWRTLGEACDERIAVGKGDLALPFEVLVESAEPQAPIAGVAPLALVTLTAAALGAAKQLDLKPLDVVHGQLRDLLQAELPERKSRNDR